MNQREINNSAFELWDVRPRILRNRLLNRLRFLSDLRRLFIYSALPRGTARILELGSGSGALAVEVAHLRKDLRITGIDVSDRFIDRANEHKGRHQKTNVDFVLYDGERIPFEDESFDCIYSSDVFGHIPDLRETFRELHRVLKPGGRLIAFSESKLSESMRLVQHMIRAGVRLDDSDEYHISIHSKQELRDMLRGARFCSLRFYAPYKSRVFVYPEWYATKLKGAGLKGLGRLLSALAFCKRTLGPVGHLLAHAFSVVELYTVGQLIETGGIFIVAEKPRRDS